MGWKGEIAQERNIAYGKLFHNKAGCVSKKWYKYLANYRRDGYDFDARYEYGLGIARYIVSEDWLGKTDCRGAYRERPEDSFERILEHMHKILPDAEEKLIVKILK